VVGLLLLARIPVDGKYLTDILPPMLLLGLGAGIAFNPLLLAAMGDVSTEESGLASGVVNTAFMMGGALGLAALSSVAASHTKSLEKAGETAASALTSGYALAFLVGAFLVAIAVVLSAVLIHPVPQHGGEQVPAPEAGSEEQQSPVSS
jgi:MFS family permease